MNKPAVSTLQIGKTLSPGILLRAKREEYGWSLTDVAHALRLSDKQVEYIEADDYGSLPGKTYVMGYWRSYSQLLKISIDDSIQIHRADLGAVKSDYCLESAAGEAKGQEESSRKRAAALFAVLLVVVLSAIWYWQNPQVSLSAWLDNGMQSLRSATAPSPEPLGEISQPKPDTLESSGDSSELAGLDTDSPVSVESGSVGGALVLPETSQVDSVLALPVPNFSEDQDAVEINTLGYSVLVTELPLSRRDLVYQAADDAVEVAAAKKATETKPKKTKPKPVTTEKKVVTANADATANSRATEPAAAGGGRIVFNVARESWIDVRDSTGERLIYRTVNRGEAISLKGRPPYSVFIGSAEGVSVQYQGKSVPFKAHESGLFARFEVGG